MKKLLVAFCFSLFHFIVMGQIPVDPTIFPHSFVVKLIMYKSGRSFHGTGVIIDKNNILSNAHNLIDKDSIKVISGYNNNSIPEIGSVVVKCIPNRTFFYDINFETQNHNLFDFAVLKYDNIDLWNQILKKSNNKQFIFSDIETLEGETINISGYPYFRFFEIGKPKKAKVQYYNSTDSFKLLENGLINYKLNTRSGSSGSPIWIENSGNFILIGIHKSGKRMNNQGIFYTKERLKLIREWMNMN
jgi:V8-like Glu-specific endopeptidase